MENGTKKVHASLGICQLKTGGKAAMVYGLLTWKFTIVSSTCATIRFCDLIVARLSEILSGYVAALLHVADHSAQ